MENTPSAGQVIAAVITWAGSIGLLVVVGGVIYNLIMKIKPVKEWWERRQSRKYTLAFGEQIDKLESLIASSMEVIREENRVKRERLWDELAIFKSDLEDLEAEVENLKTGNAVQENQMRNLTEEIRKLCCQINTLTEYLINKNNT